MDKNMLTKDVLNKMKKKKKWKLKEEQSELQLDQKILREKIKTLEEALDKLKDDQIAAYKANDGNAIALLDAQSQNTEKMINKLKADYKYNADMLEIYSKVLKNDREGKSSSRNSWFSGIGTIFGAGLAGFGLYKAYESDTKGTLTNKKTLDWARGLPILRNFGMFKK